MLASARMAPLHRVEAEFKPAPVLAGDGVERHTHLHLQVQVVGGDAGCADPGLAKTAISFRAAGLDQTAPVPIHLYIFGSRDSYQKLRTAVDACAGSYITNPDALVSIDAPPFVVVGQGPWGPGFTAAIRQGLTEAAGSGG